MKKFAYCLGIISDSIETITLFAVVVISLALTTLSMFKVVSTSNGVLRANTGCYNAYYCNLIC